MRRGCALKTTNCTFSDTKSPSEHRSIYKYAPTPCGILSKAFQVLKCEKTVLFVCVCALIFFLMQPCSKHSHQITVTTSLPTHRFGASVCKTFQEMCCNVLLQQFKELQTKKKMLLNKRHFKLNPAVQKPRILNVFCVAQAFFTIKYSLGQLN